ncbi:Z1 domain-containing protein [Akkermansiaceae bacterium]|nr:Z1 domain-containing protein [Akkermansiaceae bacterium]
MIASRIDIIKSLIIKRVKELGGWNNTSPGYLYNELYQEISNDIDNFTEGLGHPPVDPVTSHENYKAALGECLSFNTVTIESATSLSKDGSTWLTAERKEEMKGNWKYTDRYFSYLNKRGRAEIVLKENRRACESILGKMGDPKLPEFYKKGLVVGSVQSGKTENFNGVINHAIDAGYRLIIVLSGIMEDLRSQTQKRIESDVVGWGVVDQIREKNGPKGVGLEVKFGSDNSTEQASSITSFKADFSRTLLSAGSSLDNLNILVCKKNVGILTNLLLWLDDCLIDGETAFDFPLLIVDDEADNASLNNLGAKGRDYASRTNGHIRALLALFKRKTYLGYTATPFANVLQDRNEAPEGKWVIEYKRSGTANVRRFQQVGNLFPDDFIFLLQPPSNYIGAKQIFETVEPIDNDCGMKIPMVVAVDDFVEHFPSRIDIASREGVEAVMNKDEFEQSLLFAEYGSYSSYRQSTRASRKDDDFPVKLPNTLKDAVACFIIAIAIREIRSPNMNESRAFCPHNTMLVHISRFIPWQNKTMHLIEKWQDDLSARLLNDVPASDGSVYKYFEAVWKQYYANIITNISKYLPHEYKDPYLAPISYKSILPELVKAASGVSVMALNSHPDNKENKLQYSDDRPQKIIAVGGNRLSRGFTLEGLTVNYFVRTAGCSDSLLQMGRWFGYRPGYIDCCKIFTTGDLWERFDLTTKTIEELEIEFKKMNAPPPSTPNEFELRVRKHPGALKITRPSILKNAKEVKWSYQDALVQETVFSVRSNDIHRSWKSFKDNVVSPYEFNLNGGFWVADVNCEGAVDVIKSINGVGTLNASTARNICMFIKLANSKAGKLNDWKIVIKDTGVGRSLAASESGLPFDIGNMAIRKGPDEGSRYRADFMGEKMHFYATGRNRNIVTNGKDLSLFLEDHEIIEAEKEFVAERKDLYSKKYPEWNEAQLIKKAQSINKPERIYREKMSDQNALIVIYLIDAKGVFRQRDEDDDEQMKIFVEKQNIDLSIPLVGYAIAFPPISPDPGGTYMEGDYDRSDDQDDDIDEEDLAILGDVNN